MARASRSAASATHNPVSVGKLKIELWIAVGLSRPEAQAILDKRKALIAQNTPGTGPTTESLMAVGLTEHEAMEAISKRKPAARPPERLSQQAIASAPEPEPEPEASARVRSIMRRSRSADGGEP
jgi:hypothetical protein